MIPYFAMKNVAHALFVSIGITAIILLLFGFIKNYITIRTRRAGAYGAIETLLIGVVAEALLGQLIPDVQCLSEFTESV
jgi:VIT1/CCC1 family predicted Fe2+/Mn2+ transporter